MYMCMYLCIHVYIYKTYKRVADMIARTQNHRQRRNIQKRLAPPLRDRSWNMNAHVNGLASQFRMPIRDENHVECSVFSVSKSVHAN